MSIRSFNGGEETSQTAVSTPNHDDSNSPDQVNEGPDESHRTAHVARLARSFSTRSNIHQSINPFLADDPALDPTSTHFDAKRWAKALLHACSQEPDKYPRHNLGVSYRDLGAHGFGSPTDYQKDVLNVLWRLPRMMYDKLTHRKQRIQILRDFDGLVRKGEMLLVLGRPGSGVSTFLKTISGETHGFNVDEGSQLNYQGIPRHIMQNQFRGEIIYQAENDVHFPQLTVGETLLFAALARTPKARLPGVSRNMYAEQLRDVVMAMFGIYHTMHTKVGNEFIRGVSGGERKRVSIAEVMLNQSAIQCWDNSTRGLDSATALEFVRILRLSTELGDTAAAVAMYQASQPAFDVFDKVAVLYEGRQIFFGPKDVAKPYFESLGYHCPERQTTADFLTSLTNPAERIVKPGLENQVPRTSEEFAAVWMNSDTRNQLLGDIALFEAKFAVQEEEIEKLQIARDAQKAPLTREESPYTISVPMQVRLCMTRGFERLRGDKTFPLATIFGNFVISLVLGSVFYDLPPTAESINSRCILLFFAILFNALASALEILTLYAQRPVVEKHARYALYHPFSEALSSMACDLPTKLISTIVFNVPLYFMANLRQEAGAFFIYLLFGFTCTLTMSMILRTIGQTSRTIHQALTPAALFIIALVIYTGFVLPTQDMQGWLRWVNYINPIAYAYESVVANELAGRDFSCTQFVPMGPPYEDINPLQRTCGVAGAAPGTSFVNGDVYINHGFGFYRSHLWRNFGILIGYIVFFMTTYLVAAEYISMNASKGEVLIFRRGHRSQSRADRIHDEESGPVASSNKPQLDSSGDIVPEIQQQTSVFHWKDLSYDISIKGNPRRILDRVDGWVKPGTLTALMGATGAGKTTLLDVLADRINVGVVTGEVFVNGQPRDLSFQRKTGYVQQQDIHLETSTVREALQFSATLRQPSSTSVAEKYAYVEHVIGLLNMEEYSEAIIGVPGEGLNVEQRKRLTIGVELAAKPDLLLFLDEPTSGLDSQTAWSIASLIRKLSDNGQAILCTIHQPSAILFQIFDRMLLLSNGGKTVYFGDIGKDAKCLTGYFEKYGADICEKDENPAEWMLKVIGAAPGAHTDIDWATTWHDSEEFKEVKKEITKLEDRQSQAMSAGKDSTSSDAYAVPFRTQLICCTRRVFQQYWRTPSYIYSKLILSGGTSLFIGLSFQDAELSYQGLQDQMFSIFMLMVISAFLVYQTMPHFVTQRDQYEARERSSKTYAWHVFVLANILVELPWGTIAALGVFFPFYYITGMYTNAMPTDALHERGALMFLLMWSFMLFQSTFAQMIIVGVSTAEVGATISLLLFTLSLVFCGVMSPPTALPGFWIFMYRVSPFTYLIGALLSTGIANTAVECSTNELLVFEPPNGQTCGEYMASYVQFAGGAIYNPASTKLCQFCTLADTNTFLASVEVYYEQRWRNYGIVWAYIGFNMVATLVLYWLVRVPKKVYWGRMTRLIRNPLHRNNSSRKNLDS